VTQSPDHRFGNEEARVHAPHPPLTRYYADEAERHRWVRRIFDGTAGDYDRVEQFIGFGSGSWYRRQALLRAGLKSGMRILDVGVGTGLVARQAAGIVQNATLVTGIDPSAGMLENARVPPGVCLLEGSAEQIPCPSAGFDFLSMGYALRHIADLGNAFAEFFRVLKPGARLCLLEITRPEGRLSRMLLKMYLKGLVPWLARFAARNAETPLLWRYYWDTIEACVPPERVLSTLEYAGFVEAERHVELGIFSEYRARKPV
jgi:demethylmenaquinone methyltransferase/2-methoxy-6-polyprenyl-1,4-benzoquinol methylase